MARPVLRRDQPAHRSAGVLDCPGEHAGRVLRVPVDQLRVVMAQEPDLSELILRAFLLRHAILTTWVRPDADRIPV